MRTRDPYGHRWTVRRRWAPWTNYFRGPLDRLNQPMGDELHDHWSGVAGAFARATAIPLLGALVSWVFLALLLPFAVLTRVVLGRPWPVEVRRAGQLWHSEETTYSSSTALIEQIVDDISYGRRPDRTAQEGVAT